MEKEFPTDDVLSAITGRLVSARHIDGVYDVLNWMTGESLYTHQLPRVGREAREFLLARNPLLAEALAEAEKVSPDNWREWRATWIARYGATMAVPQFTADDHERIDPLSELAEHVHPDRIAVIKTG